MTTIQAMIKETSFITNVYNNIDTIMILKNEAIDRLDSIVDGLPKYRKKLEELIANFTVDDLLYLMNTIYRDNDFKSSVYYKVYNQYFDEIEDLIYKYIYKPIHYIIMSQDRSYQE